MSTALVNLSLKQKGLTSSEHSVLNILAYRANDDAQCWPSVASLCESTSLDRKTVLKCLSSLIDKKLIEKTGAMKGKTLSTPVYKLTLTSSTNIGTTQNLSSPNISASSPKNGTPKQSQNWDMERSYLNENRKGIFSLFPFAFNRLEKQALQYLINNPQIKASYDDGVVLAPVVKKWLAQHSQKA